MKSTPNLSFADLKSLVSIAEVARLLGISVKKRGREWVAPCPLPGHREKTASFTIGGKRPDQFYCFGCGLGGDCFDLIESVRQIGKHEAYLWLIETTGVAVKTNASKKMSDGGTTSGAARSFLPPQTIKPSEEPEKSYYDATLYDEVYSALLESLSLDGWAAAELARRRLDREKFALAGYRLFPYEKDSRIETAERLARQFKLSADRRVPGFFRTAQGCWCFGGNSLGERIFRCSFNGHSLVLKIPALVFPSRGRNGKIQTLKLRNPDFPVAKLGLSANEIAGWRDSDVLRYESYTDRLKYYPPKYQVVSTAGRTDGCSVALKTHFSPISPFEKNCFILTEGEFKADIIAGQLNCPVAALAGVNLHQDKLLADILDIDINFAPADLALPEIELKTFEELKTINKRIYRPEQISTLMKNPAGKSILFAFDRDNSRAVLTSLLKFRAYSELLADRCDYRFYYLFWDERRAKGFDDLIKLGGGFGLLDFNRIWKNL